jgi:exonuclease III
LNSQLIIIGTHAESSNKGNKKEIFYNKLENIIKNNITKGSIIIGGDANSMWEEKNTSNPNKSTLDKSIRDFCEKNKLVDLTREYRRKKGENKDEETEDYHTWERQTSGATKRLDSFWGPENRL